MDIFDLELSPALKAGNFAKAKLALEQWKESNSNAMYSWAKALILIRMGESDDAINILSELIDSNKDENCICRYARADIYLDIKLYEKANLDYNYILNCESIKTQEMIGKECFF